MLCVSFRSNEIAESTIVTVEINCYLGNVNYKNHPEKKLNLKSR